MATVDYISFALVDYRGQRQTVQVFFPTGYTLAEIQAFSNAIAAKLDAITGAQILSSAVSLNLTVPAGVKGSPTTSVDMERGGNLAYDAANTTYNYTVRIPGLTQALVSGNAVDDTDADLQAWNVTFLAGDGTIAPSDPFANDLTAYLGGKVTFHKS